MDDNIWYMHELEFRKRIEELESTIVKLQVKVGYLERELTKWKLEWKTGKPPDEGQGEMFHIKRTSGLRITETCYAVLSGVFFTPTYNEHIEWHYDFVQWAGPIPKPEKEGGKG